MSFSCVELGQSSRTDGMDIDMPGSNQVLLSRTGGQRVLFSMTTTLHLPGKEEFVRTALNSFIKHHPDHTFFVKRWLLINEYSPDEGASSRARETLQNMQRQYQFLDLYQKTAQDQGQARSLNMILEKLTAGNYDYWLHIEESWRTVRPFLRLAMNALDDHPYLHQLQLYEAAYYLDHTHTRITEEVKVVALNSHVDLTSADPRHWRTYSYSWPSYSLRPSLTRASFLRRHPELKFDVNPESFPVVFELDFAIRWQLLGGSMCALMEGATLRQEGHQSTYTL